MARCEDCIYHKMCYWIALYDEKTPCEHFLSTADVAPKSEVERLQSEVERLKKDNEYILMQHRFQRRPSGDCWNDVIEKAKTEAASEFIEACDSMLSLVCEMTGLEMTFFGKYAKLKKKYMEGKT